MRHKLVIAVPVLAVIVAIGAWFLSGQKPVGPADVTAPPEADQTADASTTSSFSGTTPRTGATWKTESAPIATSERATASDEAAAEMPPAQREAYVAKRVVELQDLGMEDDSESLETILSELKNPDPDIRQAAVDAAVQFGSRDAIPRLLDAAAQTDDPKEKSAMLEAVEFLKMPTLAEALAQTNNPSPPASGGSRSNP